MLRSERRSVYCRCSTNCHQNLDETRDTSILVYRQHLEFQSTTSISRLSECYQCYNKSGTPSTIKYISVFFFLSLIWLLLGFLHNFHSTSSSCEVFLWSFYRNHYINKINWIKSSFRLQPVTINGNRLIEQRYERGTVWTYRVVVKR